MDDYIIFAGTANAQLAAAISQELDVRLGLSTVERFPDGEITVQLLEPVRRKEVFIVQPTSPPVNDHLVELLAFADACHRAAAVRITAVIPYFGYARSDKRQGDREPIMASMVAHLLQAAGVDHVVMVDPHASQIEGFFHTAVDSVTAAPALCQALRPRLPSGTIVVSPDTGRVKMATRYAQLLGSSVAVLHKQRESGTKTEVTHLVGDVRDRACLIIDDMISTGSTIAKSIEALLQAGARPPLTVAVTHGLFLGGAREKLAHEAVSEIFVTDTVPVTGTAWPQLHVISIAPLIATTIQRIMVDGSISDLL